MIDGGKVTILENNPLSLGVLGIYSCGCTNRVVSEADPLIYILIGFKTETNIRPIKLITPHIKKPN